MFCQIFVLSIYVKLIRSKNQVAFDKILLCNKIKLNLYHQVLKLKTKSLQKSRKTLQRVVTCLKKKKI